MSESIYACQSYSKPKVGRFLRHGVYMPITQHMHHGTVYMLRQIFLPPLYVLHWRRPMVWRGHIQICKDWMNETNECQCVSSDIKCVVKIIPVLRGRTSHISIYCRPCPQCWRNASGPAVCNNDSLLDTGPWSGAFDRFPVMQLLD